MSDTELSVPDPSQEITGKRGLDVEKVEMIMGREQERDLTFLFRVDQLKLFDPNAKTYHRKAKSGDPVTIQLLFEMRDAYNDAKANGDPKLAHSLLKQMDDIAARAEARRDKALERLFAWKKQAEDNGKGMDGMTQDELVKMANG